MISNHKSVNKFLISIGISWILTLCVGIYAYDQMTKYDRTKIILREYFDREVAKSKVLQLFEPSIHPEVLNTLFEKWLKAKNTNILTNTIIK